MTDPGTSAKFCVESRPHAHLGVGMAPVKTGRGRRPQLQKIAECRSSSRVADDHAGIVAAKAEAVRHGRANPPLASPVRRVIQIAIRVRII